MSVRTISPGYMQLRDWADYMCQNLEHYGNLARLDREEEWQDWGATLLNIPALSGSIIPDPYQFDDWRTWAQRCNENLAVLP